MRQTEIYWKENGLEIVRFDDFDDIQTTKWITKYESMNDDLNGWLDNMNYNIFILECVSVHRKKLT